MGYYVAVILHLLCDGKDSRSLGLREGVSRISDFLRTHLLGISNKCGIRGKLVRGTTLSYEAQAENRRQQKILYKPCCTARADALR